MAEISVDIMAFGILKDILGHDWFVWKHPAPATVVDLRNWLKQFPAIHPQLPIAVVFDQMYQPDYFEIKDGMKLYLMPPVSGG
jgi:molybdopterin converting factor small subunit